MRRSVALLLVALAIGSGQPALAAEKHDLRDLRSRIEALQKELESAEGSRQDAADQLRQSERAISEQNRRLFELQQQQQQIDAQMGELAEQSRKTQEVVRSQQTALEQLLRQQYLFGAQDYLKLLLNQDDPERMARQMRYYGYLSQERVRLIREFRASHARFQQLADRTRAKAEELRAVKAEQEKQKNELQAAQTARRAMLTRISRQIQTQRREIGRLQRDEKRLATLVERLNRLSPPRPSLKKGVPQGESAPLQQPKGKLHLPVRGEVTNRFGAPREETGVVWRGLFIRAREGQEVRAISDGRVVFADWMRGFGNLIILDHGEGMMSLYGNNQALLRQVGETVKGGEPVASVGNSGGNPESGLYFEIRQQTKPVDPVRLISFK